MQRMAVAVPVQRMQEDWMQSSGLNMEAIIITKAADDGEGCIEGSARFLSPPGKKRHGIKAIPCFLACVYVCVWDRMWGINWGLLGHQTFNAHVYQSTVVGSAF